MSLLDSNDLKEKQKLDKDLMIVIYDVTSVDINLRDFNQAA